jgi:allophanate hydrolase subunit 2
VTPGAIQVPGDGRPIVLLADCQTVGGYPKIATVIGADLPRLGHALPGTNCASPPSALKKHLRPAAMRRAGWQNALRPSCPGGAELDLDALYGANLIDGVIDAD